MGRWCRGGRKGAVDVQQHLWLRFHSCVDCSHGSSYGHV